MNKRKVLLLGVVAALMSLAILAGACKDNKKSSTPAPTATSASVGTPQAATEVNANLAEYTIAPDVDTAPAGSVTFNASNIGSTDHELVIIKTDLAEGALPTAADSSVDEAGPGVEAIDEIAEFAAQGEESLTVELDAGNYVLICNVVEEAASGVAVSHYQEGMHTTFVVTE